MNQEIVLSIDQGTTGTTIMFFDYSSKKIIGSKNQEFKQYYPKTSWVEHDLDEIWDTVENCTKELINELKINPKKIISIGITNQRETTCAFTKQGNPIERAIVWQDKRTISWCKENSSQYNLKKTNGLPLDPYFSGTKIKWFLENSKKVQKEKDKNNLCFGTIDTYLLFKLTNHKSFFTEPTNASRTLLMNLETSQWSGEALDFLSISKENLPEIKNTFDHFGLTENLNFLPDGIPITCLFGDQQSALFGQACIKEGDIKCTYGTGAFALLNTGTNIFHSNAGLLSTVAYKNKEDTNYALEGSSFIAGAAVQFLRDNLKFFKKSEEIENLTLNSLDENTKDLIFFPYLTGLGSPFWKPEAKGSILGLTRSTNISDISKVTLEGVAFSIMDLIHAFESDFNKKIHSINVDGGASKNDYLMRIQSSILNSNIKRPQNIETTAFGSILGSLIGLGKISINEVKNFWELDQEFKEEQTEYLKIKKDQWKKLQKKIFL